MQIQFSIVIPYWNKYYEIALVLKALSLQDYDLKQFEIIIIDDGSDQRIDPIIDRYKDRLNIVYQYNPRSGNRGRNRNLGVKLASA